MATVEARMDDVSISIPVDMDDLRTQVKLPEGCIIVVALRLPSGQLIELSDLRDQDRTPVESSPEAVEARADANAELAALFPEIADREDRAEPVNVDYSTAVAFLRALLSCRKAGHDMSACDDPKTIAVGFMDHTANQYRTIRTKLLHATWEGQDRDELQTSSGVQVQKAIEPVDNLLATKVLESVPGGAPEYPGPAREFLFALLQSPKGRAQVFGDLSWDANGAGDGTVAPTAEVQA